MSINRLVAVLLSLVCGSLCVWLWCGATSLECFVGNDCGLDFGSVASLCQFY